jgi:hypothetical protein
MLLLLFYSQDASYNMELYKNTLGEDCVTIENADGSVWSGLKSAYDAEQEAKANAQEL